MKKIMFLSFALILFVSAQGQDIPQSQVPQIIVEKFQKSFPKAIDLEWEIKGVLYKAEFEIGLLDHDVWYDANAKIVRHEEDISSTDIASAVQAKVKSDFAGYRITECEKITSNEGTTYLMELKNSLEEWDILFGSTGNIIQKVMD